MPFSARDVRPGIDGMIHVSDVSWTREIKHPSEVFKKGEELEAVGLKKRVDLSLSMTQLVKLLGFGFTATAIEKWEKNQNRPTEPYRSRIMEFLGFDPDSKNSTGGSPVEHLP